MNPQGKAPLNKIIECMTKLTTKEDKAISNSVNNFNKVNKINVNDSDTIASVLSSYGVKYSVETKSYLDSLPVRDLSITYFIAYAVRQLIENKSYGVKIKVSISEYESILKMARTNFTL